MLEIWVHAVCPGIRSRQPEAVVSRTVVEDVLKRPGCRVVGFIEDHGSEPAPESFVRDIARDGLHHADCNLTRRYPAALDYSNFNIRDCLPGVVEPLIENVLRVNENQYRRLA